MPERFERFNAGSREIFLMAHNDAVTSGSFGIDTLNLAAACLLNKDIQTCMEHAGFPAGRIITRDGETLVFGLSKRAKQSIEFSIEEADLAKDHFIRPNHIMLGVFRVDPLNIFDMTSQDQAATLDRYKEIVRVFHRDQIETEMLSERASQLIETISQINRDKNLSYEDKRAIFDVVYKNLIERNLRLSGEN